MEPDILTQLSTRVADLAADAASHVVRVDGRRVPSSGVIWSADGVIVTAHHTLDRDEAVAIALPSGEEAEAEIVGRDPTTDLAALRVKSAGALAPVAWADEASLRPGQLVLGVSRPGRSPRAELAALARAGGEFRGPGGGKIGRFLETTLERHPGVSGALVVAPDGTGVGLATAGLHRGAVLAIPPSTLRRVVKALLSHGEIRRGYLGIATSPVPLPAGVRAATGEEVGLLVSRVEPESPAARAGLLLGDAILSVGGERLQDPSELLALLAEDRIGDTVTVKVLRAGEVRDVAITVGARGERTRP